MNRTLTTIAMMLALTLVSVAFGATGKRVTVHVKGMACPFCAYNIEKRIKTLDAVPDNPNYEASVDKGQVSFDWKADAAVDKAAIREQIEKAGFTPGDMTVVEKGDDANKSQSTPAGEKGNVKAATIENITGVSAKQKENGVVKIAWLRDEVPVKVDGTDFPPAAGLGSWASFKPDGKGRAIVMGDTVVFPDEVDAAIDAALEHGLRVTALHNHFFYDRPKVFFMHIGGHGETKKLARGVKTVWDAIKQVRSEDPQPATGFPGKTPVPEGELDAKRIEQITGLAAAEKPGGVLKVTAGDEARAHGIKVSAPMGLTTWAAFTGSNELASIDGDFLMTEGQVQPVMHALRKHGIHIVALHNHMIGEQPPLYFLHFWAKGSAEKLAQGFRAALEAKREAE